MLPIMFTVIEYTNATGFSPFRKWFLTLDPTIAAKVTKALYELEQGKATRIKHIGHQIMEFKNEIEPIFSIYYFLYRYKIIFLLDAELHVSYHSKN